MHDLRYAAVSSALGRVYRKWVLKSVLMAR
jgi:hypothetical protein